MSDQFPQRLKACREQRQLTQLELAERAKLPSTSISHFENSVRKPSFDNLRRLAQALDVPTDYLLGLIDDIDESPNPVAQRLARHVQNSSSADIDFLERFAESLGNKGKDK
jgi:transcriptional regulator with XRE-family HTH domain